MQHATGRKRRLRIQLSNSQGFSQLEILSILVILGILAAVAAPRFSSSIDHNQLQLEVQILKGHLRYAQSRALSDSRPWGLSLTANGYTMLEDGGATLYILPGENSDTHSLASGVTITTGAGTTVAFDAWGSAGAVAVTISLTGGGDTKSVVITQDTGFIE